MSNLLWLKPVPWRKEQPMYQRLIEEYLTHYQPELKADLVGTQTLQAYLTDKEAEMLTARQQILEQLQQNEPRLSQLQREMEADQAMLAMFLPLA